MSWYLDNTKLNHADLSGSIPETGICGDDSGAPYYGYPASFWQYNSTTQKLEYPIKATPVSETDLVPPYPASFWYLDVDNRLNMALLPEGPAEGAFIGCTMLEYVSIPESVQYIGEYAFKNTALTRVRLSRTCTYYPTSFPAGCEIWFYDEEPEPVDYSSLLSNLAARVTALEENQ